MAAYPIPWMKPVKARQRRVSISKLIVPAFLSDVAVRR
ncbi:hypothetical protein COLO4_02632 [Corchorus olitorius]|uniref:Uncharacterized protein n=1 Tax=Corchorus olitorius TaxID=93759 RepID=A0A1R3L0L1_9ROSI|nr:hypothetical protein COLO4_02632 [Corchorus olitorius]